MEYNQTAQIFIDAGEYFAAGFFELENASNARRYCRAYRRLYENCPMMDYPAGSPVYPVHCIRADELAVSPQYCRQFSYNREAMAGKSEAAAQIFDAFCEEHEKFWMVDGYDRVSGYFAYLDAWNHSAPNFRRITEEGLNGYERRIRQMRDEDLREALLDLMAGIRTYHQRTLAYLTEANADPQLIAALRRVPFEPVQTAYEAIVCANFVYCFDGCDNIGHAPAWLDRYWRGENLENAMHGMMKSLEDSEGWSLTVGPEYNELTKQWLRASRGLARPMVELRTAADMPEDLWQLALETVLSGGGQPSFYNEDAIISRLCDRLPGVPRTDICEFAGMGCTETSFSGMTFCGGIDANLDVLKVFEECMREELCGCPDFDTFYHRFLDRLHRVQDELMAFINTYYNKRAEISFAPVRTLFTDDCIEKETGYYQGGARYTFAVPADSGIPNTVDSLLAVKHLIFERGLYDAKSFLTALDEDDPAFRAAVKTCPAYGVADPEADALIRDLTSRFYHRYRTGKLDLGLGFLPTSHQFVRHVSEGQIVGTTPDGRRSGDALADSIAAVNGKAVQGPTFMLQSASCFEQSEVYGIAVLNLSITKAFDPSVLRALIETYFQMGGTQIQITCTTRETLLDAQANPDAHRDLVVRVGGYSYHFCRLTKELQDAVIARTVF